MEVPGYPCTFTRSDWESLDGLASVLESAVADMVHEGDAQVGPARLGDEGLLSCTRGAQPQAGS